MKRINWHYKQNAKFFLFAVISLQALCLQAATDILPRASSTASGGFVRQLLGKETVWTEGEIPTLPILPLIQTSSLQTVNQPENNLQKSHSRFSYHNRDNLHNDYQSANFLLLDGPSSSGLQYAIDAHSFSIGTDGVIRYVLITRDQSGKDTFRFEGLHCAGNEWRLYAVANAEKTSWDKMSTPWLAIEGDQAHSYHAILSQDYFCQGSTISGQTNDILKRIRNRRSLLTEQLSH